MRAILASMLMLLAVEPAKAAPVNYAKTHIEANWNIDNINNADPFSFVFFSAIYLPYDPELIALHNLDSASSSSRGARRASLAPNSSPLCRMSHSAILVTGRRRTDYSRTDLISNSKGRYASRMMRTAT